MTDSGERKMLINGGHASDNDIKSSLEMNGSDFLPKVKTTNDNSSKSTGTVGAVFIVVNAAMGAGLLNIPNGYKLAGGIGLGTAVEMVRCILFLTIFANSILTLTLANFNINLCSVWRFQLIDGKDFQEQNLWKYDENLWKCVYLLNLFLTVLFSRL